MIRTWLACWALWALLWRGSAAHLAVVNEGSAEPEQPFQIADIDLAQAFYGRLASGGADYYRFEMPSSDQVRLSLLIPEQFHSAGFAPSVLLFGPGLPPEGLFLPPGDQGMRLGRTRYQRTQRASLNLESGIYLVELRAPHTGGTYCFCVGTREPAEYADAATLARVQRLLE